MVVERSIAYQNRGQGLETFRSIATREYPTINKTKSNFIVRELEGVSKLLSSGNEAVALNTTENPPVETSTDTKPTPWDSFLSNPTPEQRFIVTYSGPYAQKMELHRGRAERFIEVAGLDGRITLTNLSFDRSRSIAGVNSDGSASARRNLFWGEKVKTEEDERDQKCRVVPTTDGWRIEINGQKILNELVEKKSKNSLDERFAVSFNETVGMALIGAVAREKLTPEKDKTFWNRVIASTPAVGLAALGAADFFVATGFHKLELQFLADTLALVHNNLLFNGMTYIFNRRLNGKLDSYLRPEMRQREPFARGMISLLYAAYPSIEVDRVLRGVAFTNFKGRNLVRLNRDGSTPVSSTEN